MIVLFWYCIQERQSSTQHHLLYPPSARNLALQGQHARFLPMPGMNPAHKIATATTTTSKLRLFSHIAGSEMLCQM